MQDQDNGLSHPSQRRYPPELRERATRMVLEAKASGERYGVVSRVARQLGVEPETLRHWAARAEVDEGLRPGVPTKERARIGRARARGEGAAPCQRDITGGGEFLRGGARPPTAEVVGFIDTHKDRRTDGLTWGVEPICRVLHFAPSAYYGHKSRTASRRSVEDAELKRIIVKIWKDNYRCYGAEKIWRQLQREGISYGRDRVARLVRELGICGVVRGKPRRTTVPAPEAERPGDLVKRDFSAPSPNRLWVADITYCRTQAGFVCTWRSSSTSSPG